MNNEQEYKLRKEKKKNENLQTKSKPSVIILGAGASGIAAASRLFENGFENVKILEAENRIGGRVFTTKFGEYLVDIGGQWVNGEVGNIVFERAWPLGLLQKENTESTEEILDSSGNAVEKSEINSLTQFHNDLEDNLKKFAINNDNESLGVHYKNELDKYIETNPKWKENKEGLINSYKMLTTLMYSSESWDDVSTVDFREFDNTPGDYFINWKERGYSTILDVIMKRYPKPEEELPIMSNTKLNSEVSLIDYSNRNGKVIVKTKNGDEYSADYVIVTFSIGVLKEIHKFLFKPPLPEEKQKAIESMNYGNVAKILLIFDEPWWSLTSQYFLLWKEKDLEILDKDNERSWLRGLFAFFPVENKPKLLCGWVSGKHSRDVEMLTDEQVKNHCNEVLEKFFGKIYNVTKPTAMMRSMWHSNKYFRGTNSYRSPNSDHKIPIRTKLSEPIGGKKPVILFAGEATNPQRFSAVHGAIETGYREADRIINLHRNLEKN